MALKKRTEEQIKELERRAAIMRAFCEGKPIQSRSLKIVQEWKDSPDPGWWWRDYEYRVKPEPRELYEVRAKEGVGYWGEPCISMIAAERKLADAERASPGHYRIVTFREVIEEN